MTAFFDSLLRSIWPLMELPAWLSAFIQSARLGWSWLNHSLRVPVEPMRHGREPEGAVACEAASRVRCLDATGGLRPIVRWVYWLEGLGCRSACNTGRPSSTDSRLGVGLFVERIVLHSAGALSPVGGLLRAAEGTGLFPRAPTSDGQTSGRFSVLHPNFPWPAARDPILLKSGSLLFLLIWALPRLWHTQRKQKKGSITAASDRLGSSQLQWLGASVLCCL